MVDFVNPYTFVRAAEPVRTEPSGHLSGADRLVGTIDISITTVTPLLIGGHVEDGALVPPRTPENDVRLPGSSLKGVVRSLHETLAGGCMRVLDLDHVPVHREVISARMAGDRRAGRRVMGVVDEAGEAGARPPVVRLCDKHVDVRVVGSDGRVEKFADGRVPTTGDHFDLDGASGPADASDGTPRVWASSLRAEPGLRGPTPMGRFVVLVTETSARSARRPCQFRAGRVGSERQTVPSAVWQQYQESVAGAEDLRPAKQTALGAAATVAVRWPPRSTPRGPAATVIGHRVPSSPELRVGQPVWVELDATGVITRLSLAQAWRARGTGTVGERAGAHAPCSDPRRLCPSCALFGSVDAVARDGSRASEAKSYAGHVRFMDAVAADVPLLKERQLAPLLSPKTSAGQHYLDNSGVRVSPQRDRLPLAFWGSAADTAGGSPRAVNRRKYYWRTKAQGTGLSARATPAAPSAQQELGSRARLVPVGVTFVGRVTVDGITTEQLGSLLGALDPRLVLDDGSGIVLVQSVGGGKPLGLGAVQVTVTEVSVAAGGDRYLGAAASVTDLDAAVREFVQAQRTEVAEVWDGLRNALTLDFVPDDLVSYPPGRGALGTRPDDQGFGYWTRTRGERLSMTERPFDPLPSAESPAAEHRRNHLPDERPVQSQGRRKR